MDVQVSLQDLVLIAFGYIPINGIDGSCGRSIFGVLKNRRTFFIVATPQCIPTDGALGPLLSTSSPALVCFTVAVLTGVRQHRAVVLICISLMIEKVEHLCMFIGSLGFVFYKRPVHIFCHFPMG